MDHSIKQILSQCSVSTRMTALTFFPERFTLPFAEQVHTLKWFIIFLCLLLTGCTLCRYQAMLDYGRAVEDGYKPEFVLYTTTMATQIAAMGMFNGHVQPSVIIDGKRKWVSAAGLSDEPDVPLGEYCWVMNLEQYVEWLRENKRLQSMPYPSKEHRDKYWPKCADLS